MGVTERRGGGVREGKEEKTGLTAQPQETPQP